MFSAERQTSEEGEPQITQIGQIFAVFAKDGSLTIYIQADSPPESQRANWLPAPKGDFTLYLRAYWPKVEVIDGSWTPPPVERRK